MDVGGNREPDWHRWRNCLLDVFFVRGACGAEECGTCVPAGAVSLGVARIPAHAPSDYWLPLEPYRLRCERKFGAAAIDGGDGNLRLVVLYCGVQLAACLRGDGARATRVDVRDCRYGRAHFGRHGWWLPCPKASSAVHRASRADKFSAIRAISRELARYPSGRASGT